MWIVVTNYSHTSHICPEHHAVLETVPFNPTWKTFSKRPSTYLVFTQQYSMSLCWTWPAPPPFRGLLLAYHSGQGLFAPHLIFPVSVLGISCLPTHPTTQATQHSEKWTQFQGEACCFLASVRIKPVWFQSNSLCNFTLRQHGMLVETIDSEVGCWDLKPTIASWVLCVSTPSSVKRGSSLLCAREALVTS